MNRFLGFNRSNQTLEVDSRHGMRDEAIANSQQDEDGEDRESREVDEVHKICGDSGLEITICRCVLVQVHELY